MNQSNLAKNLTLINIEIQICSLEARRDKARQFILNSDLMLEADLLDAQIKALENLAAGIEK